ncbi:MAG: PqiC family protein [Burkholderiales bacterium]|nr:PqiC family protein [Burkholderiales bacterium]
MPTHNTTDKEANYHHLTGARGLFALIFVLLTGCALPQPPARPTVYDFGPGPTTLPATAPTTHRLAPLPPIALAEVSASPALDGTAVLYRLAYADAFELRPYAQARWSMAPAQLLHQRLRDGLGQRRTVLDADGASVLPAAAQAPLAPSAPSAAVPADPPAAVPGAPVAPVAPRVLRVTLEEFSHLFETPERSVGLVRLRATVLEATPGGERLLAQRSVIVQRPATQASAPGGVRALAAATDAAVAELALWLAQIPVSARAGN